MKRHILMLSALALMSLARTAAQKPLYKDASQSVEARVADLLGRMTIDEKMAQVREAHNVPARDGRPDAGSFAAAYDGMSWGAVEAFSLSSKDFLSHTNALQRYFMRSTRLGIPTLTVAEGLHGVVHDGSTIFPQHIALGSTWNVGLVGRVAQAIGREARATGIRQLLAPDIDICRDPRWGRVEECTTEDPWQAAVYGVAEVKAIQGEGVATCVKHFGPHGEPVGGINLGSVHCSQQELLSTHLLPFERVVRQAKPLSMMTSYDTWNGTPNTASRYLLTDLLRRSWGFDGYVYSDWGCVGMLANFHHTAHNIDEAGAQALQAGMDLDANDAGFDNLDLLAQQGRISQADIDTACARVLRVKFRLGLFDSPLPTEKERSRTVHNPEHIALARQAAEESIVLLKNNNNLLPLSIDSIHDIALIGPSADNVQLGDYCWSRSNNDATTLRKALERQHGDKLSIHYARGCTVTGLDSTGFAEAIDAARRSQVAVVVVGSSSASFVRDYSFATCGEGFDLSDLTLTGYQQQLVDAVVRQGKPTIVVMSTGRPFAIPEIKRQADALLVQYYGGEEQGTALANVLFGAVNPSGRLTVSWPQSPGNLPCYYNHLPSDRGYYNRPGTPERPGRDYVVSSPGPLFAFGEGLSYTSFEYSSLTTDKADYAEDDTISVSFDVRNSGQRDGMEVVQLYFRDLVSSVETPVQQLRGFSKIALRAGETRRVSLKVPVSDLALVNASMQWVVEPGRFELQVGHASNDIRLRQVVSVNAAAERYPQLPKRTAKPASGDASELTYSGLVTDVQGYPLQGAQVKAGSNSVATDSGGHFSIKAKKGITMSVTAAGFVGRDMTLNTRTALTIRLDPKN